MILRGIARSRCRCLCEEEGRALPASHCEGYEVSAPYHTGVVSADVGKGIVRGISPQVTTHDCTGEHLEWRDSGSMLKRDLPVIRGWLQSCPKISRLDHRQGIDMRPALEKRERR